jgi:hypothetical protein
MAKPEKDRLSGQFREGHDPRRPHHNALVSALRKNAQASGAIAIAALTEVASDPGAPRKERLEAAKALLSAAVAPPRRIKQLLPPEVVEAMAARLQEAR